MRSVTLGVGVFLTEVESKPVKCIVLWRHPFSFVPFLRVGGRVRGGKVGKSWMRFGAGS